MKRGTTQRATRVLKSLGKPKLANAVTKALGSEGRGSPVRGTRGEFLMIMDDMKDNIDYSNKKVDQISEALRKGKLEVTAKDLKDAKKAYQLYLKFHSVFMPLTRDLWPKIKR